MRERCLRKDRSRALETASWTFNWRRLRSAKAHLKLSPIILRAKQTQIAPVQSREFARQVQPEPVTASRTRIAIEAFENMFLCGVRYRRAGVAHGEYNF